MVTPTAGRRWLTVAAVAAVVVAGLQVVTAQPAAALPTLTLTVGHSIGGANPDAVKVAQAFCELDQVVVGGGGEVLNEPPSTTVITALEPHSIAGATPPRFVVRARALNTAAEELWLLRAYALCAPAPSMQPYQIVKSTSAFTQAKFKAGTAKCQEGRVAYSAGVTTSRTSDFGVQMVRTSGPLDIARATVRAFNSAAVPDKWQLSTFAVCGPRKDGIVAVSRVVTGAIAGVSCPTGTQQIHGAGGGLGLTDGGENWIREVRPTNMPPSPGSMSVRMSLSGPAAQMVAHTTCATRTPPQ